MTDSSGPNIVVIDIETSPIEARVWGLYNQDIGLNQIIRPSRVLCAAWTENLAKHVNFTSEWDETHEGMVNKLYKTLDWADVVVHYNGKNFDVPRMNTEFVKYGYKPPSPFSQIDLYRAIKQKFQFASNRLDYISQELLQTNKIKTDMDLWNKVLEGNAAARSYMKRYNKYDVELTQSLYLEIQPWIERHANLGLYSDSDKPLCTGCGSANVERRGYSYTGAGRFQRYQCRDCGRWLRDAKRLDTTPLRESV